MKIIHEKSGVIGETRVWVGLHKEYIYVSSSFLGLLWNMIRNWNNERNLVG